MPRARVLLADDHQAILELVTRLLTPDFEVVGTVGDGPAVLDGVTTLKPDVLVLDISMPSMCGLEVARRLLQRPDAPRIVGGRHAALVFLEIGVALAVIAHGCVGA